MLVAILHHIRFHGSGVNSSFMPVSTDQKNISDEGFH